MAAESDPGMTLEQVVSVLTALREAEVEGWLEGGWGVDALVGHQTRPHRDLDFDIDARDEEATLRILRGLGYEVQTDERPTRVELGAPDRGSVDVHPLQFDPSGDALQAAPDGTFWHFPQRFFTQGRLGLVQVGCYTVEAQRFFRTGYELRPQDRLDLETLLELERGAR